MKKSIPAIRDVAAGAGVSTATVSKFVNGAQRFSPAVAAAISKVIAEPGWRSNPQFFRGGLYSPEKITYHQLNVFQNNSIQRPTTP